MTWSLRECDCCNSSAVRAPLLKENVSSRHRTQDELLKYEFDLLRTYCPHCRHKRNPIPSPLPRVMGVVPGPDIFPRSHRLKTQPTSSSSATTVHACLDYTLMDYSHLDYRRSDYKAIWTIPNWTTYIWCLDYRRLDYKHCQRHNRHEDCIHITQDHISQFTSLEHITILELIRHYL